MDPIMTDGESDKVVQHGEIRDSQGPSTVITNNDEAHVLTPGKMSQRQGKEGYITPTKELFQPSLSPGTAHAHGFDRGKDDTSQSKDDSTQSISKSKSESKLYNGSEKEIAAAATTTTSSSAIKLTKKESLKVQKKNYREEKKRATKELLSTITDPSVIVMADWLKVRVWKTNTTLQLQLSLKLYTK